MENKNQEQNGFSYTYSAKEQAELKKIREKYTTPTEAEDKMTRLRRLDASVTKSATTVALIFGIIGSLTMGFGMSLFMTELGELLAIPKELEMVLGIAIGVIGGILAGIAYPLYQAIAKAKRKQIAPEILRLTDELMK